MLPNLLLCSSTVCTSTQDCLHLFHASKEDLSGNEPTNALMTRRASQTTLVGPELIKVQHTRQRKIKIHLSLLLVLDCSLIEANHRGQLAEESGIAVTRVETEGKNSLLVAVGISVNKVHLRFAAVTTNRVISGCVNVPADQIDGLVVVGERRVGGQIVATQCECGPVTPVSPGSGRVAGVVVKCGKMVQGQTIVQRQRDGRLLCSSLTELVHWVDLVPVIGCFIRPFGVLNGLVRLLSLVKM